MTDFRLRLHLCSDWRIGTGTGRQGSIDGIVARDVHDLPYVPAKTLRGMWRDAAEQIAYGLDGGKTGGDWAAAVEHLFGGQPALGEGGGDDGPVPGRLSLADARFPDALGLFLESRPTARAAFCFVKSGVAIDPASGRARDDYLRFDEIARTGAVLDTRCTIESTGRADDDLLLTNLALVALRLVERVGGDRRRGAGRCRIVPLDADGREAEQRSDEAVAWLDGNHERAAKGLRARLRHAAPPLERTYAAMPDGSAPSLRLGLALTITAPTTVAAATLGNLVATRDHVPGTLLVGAAAELLGKAGVSRQAFDDALASGRIRVLPAYPARDGRRAIPAPFTIEEKKDKTSAPFGPDQPAPKAPRKRGYMRVRPADSDSAQCEPSSDRDTDQYKPLRADYCLPEPVPGTGLALAAAVERTLRTHNSVEDKVQKPTEKAGGGVYVLEALRPGTELRGEIVVEAGTLARDRADGLLGKGADARLGRAKRAGYGRAEVSVVSVAEATEARPAGAAPVLLVASDLILPAGAPLSPADALRELLREAGLDRTIDPDRSDLRFRRLDGWIGAWGLPRPTLTAVQAGSVIVLDGGPIDAPTRARLEKAGLGQRRGEGFGDVLVDPDILRRPEDPARLNPPGSSNPDDESDQRSSAPARKEWTRDLTDRTRHLAAFLQTVEDAAVGEIVRGFTELAASEAKTREKWLGWRLDGKKPPSSQLGTVRALIDATAATPDFRAALTFLRNTVDKPDRCDAWGGDGVVKKLIALLERANGGDAKVWTILAAGDRAKPFETALGAALIASTPDEAKARFAARATADFLLAAMRQHKRAGEERDERSREPATEAGG